MMILALTSGDVLVQELLLMAARIDQVMGVRDSVAVQCSSAPNGDGGFGVRIVPSDALDPDQAARCATVAQEVWREYGPRIPGLVKANLERRRRRGVA